MLFNYHSKIFIATRVSNMRYYFTLYILFDVYMHMLDGLITKFAYSICHCEYRCIDIQFLNMNGASRKHSYIYCRELISA